MNLYGEAKGTLVLAHRGGACEAPENSLQAFQHANAIGITYLETDVRAASDGTLYLAHGATSVLPNQPFRPIRSSTTLEELFDACPDSYFAIDPKHSRAVEPLANLVAHRGLENRVCIGSSFDKRAERTADRIEQLSGKRPKTALVSVTALAKLFIWTARPNNIQAAYIHVPAILINETTIKTAHNWGLKIIAWVLNDEISIKKAISLGVDGFMTDYPTIAIKIVAQK